MKLKKTIRVAVVTLHGASVKPTDGIDGRTDRQTDGHRAEALRFPQCTSCLFSHGAMHTGIC